MCPQGRAHWHHLANTIELVLSSAHPTLQPKRQIDRFSRFCTDHGESPYTLQWAPLSSKIDPSHGGSRPPSNTWFLGSIRAHKPNGISIGSPVLHRWPQSALILYNGTPISPWKLPLPMGGSWTPSNTWFPKPTQVLNPNDISIGSAALAGLSC